MTEPRRLLTIAPTLIAAALACSDGPTPTVDPDARVGDARPPPTPDARPSEPPDSGPTDLGPVDVGSPDAGPALEPPPPSLCAPGELGSFLSLGALNDGRESHGSSRLPNGELMVIGGWSGEAARADLERTAPDDLERWSVAGLELSAGRQHHGIVQSDRALCVIGGDDGETVGADVRCVAVTATGDVETTWRDGPDLPEPRSGHETVVRQGVVHVLGGVEVARGTYRTTVFRSRLGPDGVPGPWTTDRELPTPLGFGAAAAGRDRIYYVGGISDDGLASTRVLSAAVGDDGALGPWTEAARLPGPAIGSSAHVASDMLWVVGGFDGDGVVEVGGWPIGADGTLGTYQPGPSLPAPRWGHASVIVDGRLLVVGGWQSLDRAPTRTVFGADCP